jgi:hypothetical protein
VPLAPLLAAWLAAGPPATAAPAVPIERGRTNEIVAVAEVGAPLERAVVGRAYARAAAADAEQRWSDAESLYREAVGEWNAAARIEPSRALELAIAKAERERQRSQLLATRARLAASRAPAPAPSARRAEALDEARLLRGKLMAARAITGRVSPALYARARARLEDALRAREPEPPKPGPGEPDARRPPDDRSSEDRRPSPEPRRWPGEAEIYLLLCATRAVAGEPEAARLARAHVTEADRAEPTNTVALAICAAALGETDAALRALELHALNPGPGHPDRFNLRDLYLANDWDRLRGDPRFESLFPR